MNINTLFEYTKKLSVLYVEDDAIVRENTQELLSIYFKELTVAVDGLDALEKFKEASQEINLVISDINMPNINGLEMTKILQEINPDLPIIFISAHHEVSYLQGAIDIGVSSFLSKPINREKLEYAIFKVAQAISDHDFVLTHVDLIEDLNMQLETQNLELVCKNNDLEKSLRLLDTMVSKEQITHSKVEEKIEVNSEEDAIIDAQISQLVHEDLHELVELCLEIDTSVIKIINTKDKIYEDEFLYLLGKFTRYSSILSYYNFFNNLSSAMKDFIGILSNNPIPENKEDADNIFMLLESFLYVLQKWQNELEQGNREMINFFDASIINDMQTITNMWLQTEENEEDFGEMEFF